MVLLKSMAVVASKDPVPSRQITVMVPHDWFNTLRYWVLAAHPGWTGEFKLDGDRLIVRQFGDGELRILEEDS